MSQLQTLKCKNTACGKYFDQTAHKQVFCSRACFRSVWYGARKSKPPKWRCGGCQEIIQLTFAPLRRGLKFFNFRCPKCGHRPL